MSNSMWEFARAIQKTIDDESVGMRAPDVLMGMAHAIRYMCALIAEDGRKQGFSVTNTVIYLQLIEMLESGEEKDEHEDIEAHERTP